MELKKHKGFLFVNDAYNANPFSMQQSLKAVKDFPCRKVAVLGDMLELGKKSADYHRALAKDVVGAGFSDCFLFGKKVRFLRQGLKEMGYNNVFLCGSHRDISKGLEKLKKNASGQELLIFLKGSRGMALEKVMDFI
jgi:UDP-N-acetylmuramoyl-tripeptide--D-alanyl-D-alanine ligase